MPNGHGGAPFLGAPIVFALLFLAIVFVPPGNVPGWVRVSVALGFAALAGWRLAYHLHLRDADEYDGAYTEPDAYRRAQRRDWLLAPFYALAAAVVGFGILWWRGIP